MKSGFYRRKGKPILQATKSKRKLIGDTSVDCDAVESK